MFSVVCKDPLEAEKLGQRRDRKTRNDLATPALSDESLPSRPPSSMRLDSPPPIRYGRLPTPVASPQPSDVPKPQLSAQDYFYFGEAPVSHSRLEPHKATIERPVIARGSEETSIRKGPVSETLKKEKIRENGKTTFLRKLGFSSRTPTPTQVSSKSSPTSPETNSSRADTDTVSMIQSVAHVQKPTTRFSRMLRKIEMAKDTNAHSRLNQQWEGDDEDEDMEAEFHFETLLWAIVGAEKLRIATHPVRFNPASGLEFNATGHSDIRDGMHVLYLGPIQDSPMVWYLGTKHPGTTFHCLGVQPATLELPASSWGMPPNIESNVWNECPRLPFEVNSFDIVIVQDVFHVVRCTDWTILIPEISRVLVSGGILSLSLMDPLPKRSGPLLEAWTRKNLEISLAQRFMVPQPSLMVPFWIEETAKFSDPLVEKLEFGCYPAFAPKQSSPSNPHNRPSTASSMTRKTASYTTALPRIREYSDIRTSVGDDNLEASLDSLVGHHLFQNVYHDSLPLKRGLAIRDESGKLALEPSTRYGWWSDREILEECYQYDAAFETMTFYYLKH